MPHTVQPIKGDSFEEPVSELEIVQDGCFRDLDFLERDGDTKKKVTKRLLIRRVSVTTMDTLAKAWGKMAVEATVYLDLPIADIEKLTHESFATVVKEGRRLNFTLLSKWLEWSSETLKALGGSAKFDEIIQQATKKVLESVPG